MNNLTSNSAVDNSIANGSAVNDGVANNVVANGEPALDKRKQLRGERVLICEDEGINLLQLHRIMKMAGLVVVGAALTGVEAVEIALRERPSLILMDINMPEMSGIEAMRRIFKVYTPCIVVLSAYNGEIEEEARAAGANGYITKPINSDSLIFDLEATFQTC